MQKNVANQSGTLKMLWRSQMKLRMARLDS